MASPIESLPPRTLLEATRQALASCSVGLDATAMHPGTPLASVIFDSLMAVKFIATLEADLGVSDLPFEQWLAEFSESSEALTIGSLIDWLRSLPGIASSEGE
jgi:hypothetical protein